MKSTFATFATAGCLLALVALPDTARAKDYPQRITADATSRRAGLGRTAVPLFERAAGPGAETVTSTVLSKFERSTGAINTRGTFERESATDHITLHTEDWTLQVATDGTRVSYRNVAQLDGAMATARPVEERLSQETLEALGRRFIGDSLREFITLGSSDEILPLYSEFQIIGGGGVRENQAYPEPAEVVANTVVFTRTIDGVPVVGGGSKIAITFLNDGTAVAFDFDWPQYRKTGREQEVLPIEEIRARGSRVLILGLDDSTVNVTRFECGLLDTGVRKRDAAALVQSACFVQADRRDIIDREAYRRDPASGHIITAIAQAIPAGLLIERDDRWPEAAALLGSALPSEPAAEEAPEER